MDNLIFLDIEPRGAKPKATIHLTGKLGFNKEAAQEMCLSDRSYFRIAIDGGESTYSQIYLVTAKEEEEKAIKVAKAGEYFYLNLGGMFDRLNLDYRKYSIIFDLQKSDYKGLDMFILTKRKKQKERV